ncbi:MAG: hypothetical protein RIQ81_2503 [Pseudomonadota bacterium]|jgi:hypothetical protein
MRRVLKLAILGLGLMAILPLNACRNAADDDVFLDPAARKARMGNSNANPENARKAVPIAMASYRVRVNGTGPANMEFCSGGVDLQLMSDLSFGPSTGAMICMNRPVDMGKLLQGISGSLDVKNEVQADGTMLRIKNIGGVTFEPARPLVVGPIVQNPQLFVGLDQTSNHTAKWTDPVSGKFVSTSGTTRVRVLGVKETYNSELLGRKLDQVLHWEMTSTGYDGIPKSDAFIFDRIEMLWNARPLVVPKIVIEGNVSSFVGGSSGSSSANQNALFPGAGGPFRNAQGGGVGNGQVLGRIGDIFVGKVRIELEATRFEAL